MATFVVRGFTTSLTPTAGSSYSLTRNDGIGIPDGVYRVGDIVGISIDEDDTIATTFVGYEQGTNNPIFDRVGLREFVMLFSAANDPGEGSYTPGAITREPLGIGGPIVFADVGFRPFGSTRYTSQDKEIEFNRDVLEVNEAVTLRIYSVSGGTRTLDQMFDATFLGHDSETGDLIFDPPSNINGGRDIVAASVKQSSYHIPTNDIVAEDWPPEVTFRNYGFRRDFDSDFDLQGTSPGFIALDVPAGVYRLGETLTIRVFGGVGGGESVEVEYRGLHNVGDFQYPIFEAANFEGARAQFIGVWEPDSDATYAPPGNTVTQAFATGVARFADYGLRVPEGEGETSNLNSQDREIEFDYQFLTVGTSVDLRIFRVSGTEPEVTLQAQFAGFDRETGDPLFSHPEQGGQTWRGGRQIIASSVKIPGGAYVVPHGDDGDDGDGTVEDRTGGDIIAEAWPPRDIDATYTNYGFRQGANLENDAFDLQGTGVTFGLHVPPGIYTEGNTYEIEFHGGTADGKVMVTFVGYVTGADGTEYPIFEHADFKGNGRAQFIGTNEPHATDTYTVTSGDITDDEPLGIGTARFINNGFRSGDTGNFNLSGGTIEFAQGIYEMNDPVMLTFVSNNITVNATFIGFEEGTGYPVFRSGSFQYIAVNEARSGSYTAGEIITTGEYTTCFAPGTWIATPDGERLVETLKPGDKVLTADCGVANVRWVGVQKAPTMFGAREVTHPVRIMAGALDDNVPHTDLVVTKDHGMIVDGVICHAGALINGTSIVEVSPGELAREPGTGPKGVATYYHVETWNHVPLLANGAAAESFIDNVDRERFDNHSEFVALYGSSVPPMTEMTLPRAMSVRQVPRRITSLLDERADMILGSVVRGPVERSA